MSEPNYMTDERGQVWVHEDDYDRVERELEKLREENERLEKHVEAAEQTIEDQHGQMVELMEQNERLEKLREALEKIKSVQPETVAMFRRREIVFATALGKPDDERTDAEMWEKIAFSIYSDLCEADALAAAALAFPAPDRPEGE